MRVQLPARSAPGPVDVVLVYKNKHYNVANPIRFMYTAVNETSMETVLQRLRGVVPRYSNDPERLSNEAVLVRLYEFMDTVSRANYHNIGPASIGPSATFTSHLNAHGSSFLPNRASSSSMHGFSSPFAGIADRYDASVGGSSILVSGTNTGSDSGYSREDGSPQGNSYARSPQQGNTYSPQPSSTHNILTTVDHHQIATGFHHSNNSNNSNARVLSSNFIAANSAGFVQTGCYGSTVSTGSSATSSFTNMNNSQSPLQLVEQTSSTITSEVIFPSHSPHNTVVMNTFQQPPQIVSSSNSGSHDAILSLVQSPLSLSSGKNKSAFAPVMRPLDHQSSLSANGCLSLATNGGMMHGE